MCMKRRRKRYCREAEVFLLLGTDGKEVLQDREQDRENAQSLCLDQQLKIRSEKIKCTRPVLQFLSVQSCT